MPEPVDRGQLLRGGRAVARLVLVWTLVAVSLHLLVGAEAPYRIVRDWLTHLGHIPCPSRKVSW